jgi:hypothetical protein
MALEQVEFEFPDEKEAKENARKGGAVVTPEEDNVEIVADDKPEIEIVDDTPEKDRGREPMKTPPPADLTDDDLTKYDVSVQSRIKQVQKGYHDERRAKETALREREEALRLAQQLVEENKKLKGTLSEGQTAFIEQAKLVAENEVEKARAAYKAAYEAGDSDALVIAQEALTAAKMKIDRVNNFKPTPLQEPETAVQPASQPQQVQVDPKLRAWQDRNPWWGSNKRMTAYALGFHSELVEQGHTAGSDDYYKAIDTEMRTRFPDVFESGKVEKQEDAPTPPKKSNVVAPATRSTAPKKIVLTKSQVEIAKRLGVPLELYARKVAEEMRK